MSQTTPQQKMGSGFDAKTTAHEVMEGVDLSGRTAVVTGGYSGIGTETTRELLGAGAKVIVPARRPDKARQELAASGLQAAEVHPLDLSDLDSVKAFADHFLQTHDTLHLLINNAGVMASPLFRTKQGHEGQFGTNHLGHFALTNLLWPALRNAGQARVVSLSSAAHRRSAIRWDDPDWHDTEYDKWAAYGQAKTANSLFAVHLDALGQDAGVRAFAVHPGGIMTPLQRHLSKEEMVGYGWIDEDGNPRFAFKTPQQGASTTCWCATSPQLDGHGGVYCADTDVADLVPEGADMPAAGAGVYPHAVEPDEAAKLWTLSVDLTGVDAFTAR